MPAKVPAVPDRMLCPEDLQQQLEEVLACQSIFDQDFRYVKHERHALCRCLAMVRTVQVNGIQAGNPEAVAGAFSPEVIL